MSGHNIYMMDGIIIYTTSHKYSEQIKKLGGRFLLKTSGERVGYRNKEYWPLANARPGSRSSFHLMSGREALKMMYALHKILETDHKLLPTLIGIHKEFGITDKFQINYINDSILKRLKGEPQ